jgi:HSP20 family protein
MARTGMNRSFRPPFQFDSLPLPSSGICRFVPPAIGRLPALPVRRPGDRVSIKPGMQPPTITIMTLNKLSRWNPMRELEAMQHRFENLLGHAPLQLRENGEESLTASEWSPPVDIAEDDKEYVIKAELPDIHREDVKVTVENGLLSISGERKFEKEEKNKKYHRVERAYGYFARSFSLPDAVDADQVKADFKDGMLTIHVPKSDRARPKQIEVKVS